MSFLIDNYELPVIENEGRTGYTTSNLMPLTAIGTSTSTVIVYEHVVFYFNRHAFHLLNSISKLANNWDGEDASAPPESVMRDAYSFAQHITMVGQKIYNAAPGPNGEVMISLKGKKGELELLFYPNKKKYVKLPNVGIPSQDVLTSEKLVDLLKWLMS